MKNILKNIIIACVLLTISSCSDGWLEILPKDLIVEENFWKSKKQLEEAVSGCYMAILEDEGDDNNGNGAVRQMILWGELRADNVVPGGSAIEEETKMATCNIIPSNKFCDWKFFYAAINNCNTVLENADQVKVHDKTVTDAEIKAYKAEALAVRSMLYFYLIRTYKEVPLILIASKTNEQDYNIGKSSEDIILAKIVEDLKLAYTDAIAYYDQNRVYNKGRFNKTSIAALLADVYLWMERYDDCVQACDLVLKDKNIVLVKQEISWAGIFLYGNSNESIFELQYGNNQGGKLNKMLFQSYGSNTRSAHLNVPVDKRNWDLTSIFEEEGDAANTDIRYFYSFTSSDNSVSSLVEKYSISESSNANWIVYRLAEIYLMKAEALVQLDFDQYKEDAITHVNKIYMRAHPESLIADSLQMVNYDTKDRMVNLILREKQREFLFEGKRWYDLLRTSRREKDTPMRVFDEFILRNVDSNYRSLAQGKLKNEWARYLPLPLEDVEANPNLVQNPFYETSIMK